jgi:hypothetical protein
MGFNSGLKGSIKTKNHHEHLFSMKEMREMSNLTGVP